MPNTYSHLARCGFTLIETVSVLVVLSLLLTLGLPKVSLTLNREKVKSAALGVAQFIDEAKSIAIIRNQKLWIDIVAEDAERDQPWSLALGESIDAAKRVEQRILYYQGSKDVSLDFSYLNNQFFIDGEKGKLAFGYFKLSNPLADAPLLKVITSYDAGRVRVCAIGEGLNGFPQC